MEPTSTPDDWLQRCADRLRRQWPHVPTEVLEDTARDLMSDYELRHKAPEVAAVEWLRRGVLSEVGSQPEHRAADR